jgi:ABC-type branched-subunit amino acid transport system permease subunit
MDMMHASTLVRRLTCLGAAAGITAYAVFVLRAESQVAVAGLLAFAAAAVILGARMGVVNTIGHLFSRHERLTDILAVTGFAVIAAIFYEDHYVLFMLATVMLYMVACLGLNIQLGLVGVANFSGASFFGVGCYTSAVLLAHTPVPPVVVILLGGVCAAVVGSLLILPVLRTSGHYAALVTIAFALLFKTFLDVNDTLGGPQGLRVPPMRLFGWDFSMPPELGELEISFYVPYVLLCILLLVLTFVISRRLERSWLGLNMDAVRLDETAAACFGLNLSRWKITAFTAGNLLIGMGGALYGMMIGYIAPSNFAFSDSLILLSIVLLGGMGNPWGLLPAAFIVVVLPEKFQVIQEYRFFLYATMVILMLLFRPNGLMPRPLRTFLPNGASR